MAMTSTYQPPVALAQRIIEILRGDAILAQPVGGSLMYPEWAPQTSASDLRIFGTNAYLPEDSAPREQLPRILVETMGYAHDHEQEGEYLTGPVAAVFHILVPQDREEHGARIDARVASLMLSTPLSDVRIIAAGIVADGLSTKGTIAAFNNAWEYVSRYRSPSVGVLQ